MGRGIEMIKDTEAYKEKLMTKKDKWGESVIKPEESKEAIESVAELTADDTAAATSDPVSSDNAPAEEEKDLAKIVKPKHISG